MEKVTYLAHYGIRGQRWGVRRYQNDDGSLTRLGQKRYNVNTDGTVMLKPGYSKTQTAIGVLKTSLGSTMLSKGIKTMLITKNITSEKTRKILTGAVLNTVLGAVTVTSGVQNFINANSNKTFNSTGMGGTPETFKGTQKTRAQVLAYQARINRTKK